MENTIKNKIINAIEEHCDEINKSMIGLDCYLYLVVYDKPNQTGNDWHSHTDETTTLDWVFDDILENELELGVRGTNITDWTCIKSWYLELWENQCDTDDILIKTWCGNI